MIGILVALALSWVLLYLLEKKSLLVLGFLPIGKRLKQFFIGILITGFLCVIVQLTEAYLREASWVFNEGVTAELILEALWWDIKSVLTEELIYRGALLYILIQRIGPPKSILISAIAFGVYHWFSYGVIGNIMAMIFVFIGTGLMGYAWAWAFAKTRSIMLPFGLHLGWNFCYNTLFSNGPLGELLWVLEGGQELTGLVSLFNFLNGLILVPILVLLYVRHGVKDDPNFGQQPETKLKNV